MSSPAGPLEQNEWGNIFVAPTGYLKSYTADLAADGNQGATLALYNATDAGPVGPAVWSGPATIQSTGSTSTFKPQTFTVDQPLHPNQTYAFAIASGTPTATTWWAEGHATPGSPCAPGAVVDRSVGQQDWLPPLTNEAFSFKADFLTASPPVASPSPISFPGQTAGTIGDVQAVTISSPGQVMTTLGQLRLSGQNGSDFVIVADQCSGQTLAPAASCTVGVRFGPQRTGSAARSGTLEIPYADGTNPPSGAANPPLGVVTDSLSGTRRAGVGRADRSGGTPRARRPFRNQRQDRARHLHQDDEDDQGPRAPTTRQPAALHDDARLGPGPVHHQCEGERDDHARRSRVRDGLPQRLAARTRGPARDEARALHAHRTPRAGHHPPDGDNPLTLRTHGSRTRTHLRSATQLQPRSGYRRRRSSHRGVRRNPRSV